jgi:hypothetical protein
MGEMRAAVVLFQIPRMQIAAGGDSFQPLRDED